MHPKNPDKSTPSTHSNGPSNGNSTTSSPSSITQKFLSSRSDLGVVAVGFSGGQCKDGVDAAPSALISAGLFTQISDELGYTLHGDTSVRDYNEPHWRLTSDRGSPMKIRS